MKQTNAVELPDDVRPNRWGSDQRLEFPTGRFDLFRESARGATMSQTDTLLTVPPGHTDRAFPRSLTSLIEVPDVRRPRSSRVRSRGLRRWDSGRLSRTRPKRRLRREVRIACF